MTAIRSQFKSEHLSLEENPESELGADQIDLCPKEERKYAKEKNKNNDQQILVDDNCKTVLNINTNEKKESKEDSNELTVLNNSEKAILPGK